MTTGRKTFPAGSGHHFCKQISDWKSVKFMLTFPQDGQPLPPKGSWDHGESEEVTARGQLHPDHKQLRRQKLHQLCRRLLRFVAKTAELPDITTSFSQTRVGLNSYLVSTFYKKKDQ